MSSNPTFRIEVAITGLGAVSALGRGRGALWAGIEAGRDGIRDLDRFSVEGYAVRLGALVPPETELLGSDDRCTAYALTAADEAWSAARVADAGLDPARIGVVLGTTLGHRREGIHAAARAVAARFGTAGPCVTISTACSSSTCALGAARDLIELGAADLVLAGGAEELAPEMFAGFHALGVLCPAPCAPFSEPLGMTLGEGAGYAVIEPAAQAKRRGVEPLAFLCGHGLSADAYHATTPAPTGAGVARAIRAALRDAGLSPADIGYVNVHGTGTETNDPAEWRALRLVFGEAVPAISSTKSIIGHAQGAAGILEAIATCEGLLRQRIPPTLHYRGPRLGCPVEPVAQSSPRPFPHRHSVSTNSAFGGANAAIVLSAPHQQHHRRVAPLRRVQVLGVGAVAAHGLALDALWQALAQQLPLSGRVPAFRLEALARGINPRGLDPSARFLVAATSQALMDGGIRVHGALRDRAGLMVGATQISAASAGDFLGSIARRGLARVSATAFSRMVLNAPAGACSQAFSLRGPTTTLTTGAGSGLVAILYAAHWLAARDDADLLVGGGVDELPAPGAGVSPDGQPVPAAATGEGAAGLVLAAANGALAHGDRMPVFVTGWGLAGSGGLHAAVGRALAMARLTPADIDGIYGSIDPEDVLGALAGIATRCAPVDPRIVLGDAPAASSALAAVAAVLALRRAQGRVALVVANSVRSDSAALILQAGERT